MKTISLLGATGSIGVNTLNVIRSYSDTFQIGAMAAGCNAALFAEQVKEFQPKLIAMKNREAAEHFRQFYPDFKGEVLYGIEGCKEVACWCESSIVVSSIVGAAGLLPTLAAIELGKDIALANKETLVMAGKLVMEKVRAKGVKLYPIDSEHSAIFQALEAGRREDLQRIILTASGGPFRGKKRSELEGVTPEQALAHPNWEMGRKISIDSATLMNKGLEVIEACWLFDVAPEKIEVMIHPQSIIHSAVEYLDGSVIAQMGIPDMRLPIAYALTYPERVELGIKPLNLLEVGRLDFFMPDRESFPALQLAFEAILTGGVLPAVFNAAGETAVEAFLNGRLQFLQISETVAKTMDIVHEGNENSLDDILAADMRARKEAEKIISSK